MNAQVKNNLSTLHNGRDIHKYYSPRVLLSNIGNFNLLLNGQTSFIASVDTSEKMLLVVTMNSEQHQKVLSYY